MNSRVSCALALSVLLAGCAAPVQAPVDPLQVGELRAGTTYMNGYLPRSAWPDSLALLPPPPAAGSAAALADEAASRAASTLVDTPRWRLATQDAHLRFPEVMKTFSCAFGLEIDAAVMPNVSMLLRRAATDAGLATYRAKDHYRRTRPFVALKGATCTPAEEPALSRDGSYPSGHSALGWAQALLLAELSPERADALFARGHAYGQSRVVCGVHWQSDVDMGRTVAAAAVARVHADPVFQAQLRAAQAEVRAARAAGVRLAPPAQRCEAEAAALQIR
ncbi:MAG: phosphatase PAP2 family protein [Burkholderiaceae bacterium]